MKRYTKRADGRYQARISLGKGKYKYVYAKSQKELDKKVIDVKIRLGKGIDIGAERDTFIQWAERWLKLKEVSITHSRYEICKGNVKKLEPLHNMPICKIRAMDIQDIIFDLLTQNLSKCVLDGVKNTAKQILQLAVDNRVIDYNCAMAVKIPPTKAPVPRRALTEQEQEWITAPSDNRGHRMAMIMMYAGLRRGELLALQWTDIDFAAKTITVNKSVEIINNQPVVNQRAKTKAGMRIVYIPQLLVDFLAGEDRGDSLIVCPDAKGGIMSETAYKRVWQSYQKELNRRFGDFSTTLEKGKNGNITAYVLPESKHNPHAVPMVIPNITAHMLRHTFITNMYFAGIDTLTAKEQAGHADIETTLNIYTHLDNVYKKKEVSKLDEYLAAKE